MDKSFAANGFELMLKSIKFMNIAAPEVKKRFNSMVSVAKISAKSMSESENIDYATLLYSLGNQLMTDATREFAKGEKQNAET